jgi:subtilisin family serine protease
MLMKTVYVFLAVAVAAGVASFFIPANETPPKTAPAGNETVACPMDAMLCPDGNYVGRTGPNCEFICPPAPPVPDDIQAILDEKAGRIVITSPSPDGVIKSPLLITGVARGEWYFEARFPVTLVDWNGLIIADGYATAGGDWNTEDFVPFSATLEFVSPYKEGDPDFMKKGALIFQRNNVSGLPEHDEALEVPVSFAP